MGACCGRLETYEDKLIVHFKNLKLKDLDYDHMESIFETKLVNLELTEEFKMKLNGKNLHAFEDSLKKISKENLIKLAEKYFIDPKDKLTHINVQLSFFKLIADNSNNNKRTIIFLLLSFLKNDKEKYNIFLNLCHFIEGSENIRYLKFKNIFTLYVRSTLILPLLALKENLDNTNKMLSDEIDYQITSYHSDSNIKLFIEKVFEDFEAIKFSNLDEFYVETFVIKIEDLYDIFRKYGSDYFNFNGLRSIYSNYIKI
jgi:hypothetical protein